jgi:PAS domain S-box-containing protein
MVENSLHDNPLNILVVDDNATDLLLLEEALGEVRASKFALTGVMRLDEALAVLHDKRFDVVLLHLGLPDSQGLETFVRLQREHPAIPILILSGRNDEPLAIQAVQGGAQDFVAKDNIRGNLLARTIRYAIERKRSERKSIASEAGYRRLFETAHDGIFILDAETGQITDANPSLEKLLGYTIAELIGKRLWEIAPFRDKAASQAAFRTLQEKGYFRYDALPLMTKDGKQVDVEFVSNVYEVGSQRVIQCSIRDVSERKEAQAGMARLAAIVESSDDAIISKTLAGIITSWNAGAVKIYGYSPQEATGRSISMLATKDHPDEERQLLDRIAQGEHVANYETVRVSKNGRQVDVSLTLSPVKNGAGEIIGASAISRDITERKRAEETLAQRVRLAALGADVGGALTRRDALPEVLHLCTEAMVHHLDAAFARIWTFNEAQDVLELQASAGLYTHLDGPHSRVPLGTLKIGLIASERQPHLTNQVTGDPRMGDQEWAKREGMVAFAGYPLVVDDRLVGVVAMFARQPLPEITLNALASIADEIALGIERKRTEESLQQERDFIAAVIDTVGNLVVVLDRQGHVVRFNRACEQISGYTFEEVKGRNILDLLLSPGEEETVKSTFDYICSGHYPNTRENCWVAKNGSRCLIAWANTALLDAEGAVEYVIGTGMDITDRTRAEEEKTRLQVQVEKQSQRLDTIVASVPGMVWEAWGAPDNATQRIDFMSNYVTTMLGYSVEEWLVTPNFWLTIVHPDDKVQAAREAAAIFASGQGGTTQFRWIAKDGHVVWAETQIVVICDEAGIPLGLRGVSMDISERKQGEEALLQAHDELETRVEERTTELQKANEELQTATKEAERANHAKSEFLSRMSHELRTPLNAILGFGQILEMQELTPLQSESTGHILKGGRHLLELINEVLDIARIEAGHMDLSTEPVSISEVITESLDLTRPLAAQHSIQIDGDEGMSCTDYVMTDRQRLKQVLINLLSNAIKYNRKGGRVTVTCQETPENRLRIQVTDTGFGIASHNLEKLFMPFERLGAEKSGIEGTGLGLAFSRRMTEAMNGTLAVETVEGQGSTFIVDLPSTQCPLAKMGLLSGSEVQADKASTVAGLFKVLSIEDNASNFRLIEAIMAHRPEIKLEGVTQGIIGLELASQHHYDLILLDLHLPDITGYEVLCRLRESPETQHIPIIVISADATPPQIKRLLEAGANFSLTKPLDVKNFLQVLEEALPRRDFVAVGADVANGRADYSLPHPTAAGRRLE